MTLSTHEERVIAELETQFRREERSRVRRRDPLGGAMLLLLAIVLLFVGRKEWFVLRISHPLGLAVHEVQRIFSAAGFVIVLCAVLMLGRAVRNLRRARRARAS
jgi:hypothetical protein